MKRYIFLDIDGVICLDDGYDEKSIHNLNKLISIYSPKIIISSDKRLEFTSIALKKELISNGLLLNEFDITDSVSSYKTIEEKRYLEINKYIKDNGVVNYIVIDDLNLQNYFENRFIKTSYSIGFTEDNINQINNKLF